MSKPIKGNEFLTFEERKKERNECTRACMCFNLCEMQHKC